MNLLRIGNKIINMDNVVEAHTYAPGEHISNYFGTAINEGILRVVLRTTATGATWVSESYVEPSPFEVWLDDDEAEAFLRWTKRSALDLTSESEEATEFRHYREAGGPMLFSEWQRVWHLHKAHIASGRISPYEGDLKL